MRTSLSIAFATLVALSASFSINAEKPKYKWILGTELERIFAVEYSPDTEYETPSIMGLIDAAGNVLIDGVENYIIPSTNVHGDIYFFNPEGYALYGTKGKGLGVINKNLNVVIEPQFKNLELLGSYAVAGMDDEGRGGQIICIPENKVLLQVSDRYRVNDVNDNMILAMDTKNDDQHCYLNIDGKIAIPSSRLSGYREVCKFSEDRAAVITEDDKLGYIDKSGKEVIPTAYPAIEFACYDSDFKDGLVSLVNEEEKYGVIDKEGKVVIPFKYTWYINFDKGTSIAITEIEQPDGKVSYKYDLIDRKGNVLKTTPEYFSRSEFWSGEYDNAQHKYRYVGLDAKEKLPAVYDEAGVFLGGLAIVKIDGKWCVINEKGEIVLDNMAIWSFSDLPG